MMFRIEQHDKTYYIKFSPRNLFLNAKIDMFERSEISNFYFSTTRAVES